MFRKFTIIISVFKFYKDKDPEIRFLNTRIFDILDCYLIYTGILRNSTTIVAPVADATGGYELGIYANGANPVQKGSGFSIDPNEFIAGQAVVKSYDDCCPPAIVRTIFPIIVYSI